MTKNTYTVADGAGQTPQILLDAVEMYEKACQAGDNEAARHVAELLANLTGRKDWQAIAKKR